MCSLSTDTVCRIQIVPLFTSCSLCTRTEFRLYTSMCCILWLQNEFTKYPSMWCTLWSHEGIRVHGVLFAPRQNSVCTCVHDNRQSSDCKHAYSTWVLSDHRLSVNCTYVRGVHPSHTDSVKIAHAFVVYSLTIQGSDKTRVRVLGTWCTSWPQTEFRLYM